MPVDRENRIRRRLAARQGSAEAWHEGKSGKQVGEKNAGIRLCISASLSKGEYHEQAVADIVGIIRCHRGHIYAG